MTDTTSSSFAILKVAEQRFPIILKAAGRELRILRDPVVHHSHGCHDSETCHCKRYESYVLSYHIGTKRWRVRCSSLAKAKKTAAEVKLRLLQEDPESLMLTGKNRREFLMAKEILGDTPLEAAAQEFVNARRELAKMGLDLHQAVPLLLDLHTRSRGCSLTTAIDFYLSHGNPEVITRPVSEIVNQLLAGLAADRRGKYHLRDLRLRLSRFTAAFPGLINEVTTSDIETWLRGLKKKSGDPISATTRNNYRDAVLQLFQYAKAQGFLPKTVPTAADELKRVVEVPGENCILTAKELTAILRHTAPEVLPGLLVKAFCGLRTEEAANLEWSHISMEKKTIILPAQLTKLKQRRAVQMPENLLAWLEPFAGMQGKVCGNYASAQSAFKRWERAAGRAGLSVGKNRLRNSFISYHVALHNEISVTAYQSGNSEKVIQKEYLELATKSDALAWFNVRPDETQLASMKTWADQEIQLQIQRRSLGLPVNGTPKQA